MSAWRIESPAPRTAALELAGASPRLRRLVLGQLRLGEAAAVYLDDELLALAMFRRHGWRRIEMALAVAPEAAPHMRRLIRMTQLTLARLGEDRLVVARVHPLNQAGRRMASLVGFRPARLRSDDVWIFRGDE